MVPTKKPRFMVTVSDEMLRQIDNYRFGNRCRSQTDAINQLIERGLDVVEVELGKNLEPVISDELSEDEAEFLSGFASLSPPYRRLLLGILALLLQEQGREPDSHG